MKGNVKTTALPLVFGLVGAAAFLSYFFVKDSGSNLAFGLSLLLPPAACTGGLIAAFATRQHKTVLWRSGLALCVVMLGLYALLIALLIVAVAAIAEL